MTKVTLAVSLAILLIISGSLLAQSATELTVPRGVLTNGTAMAMQQLESIRKYGANKPSEMVEFTMLNADMVEADTFFLERTRTLHTDEIECSELWFGMGLACKKSTPTVVVATVVTKPMTMIFQYWMDKIRGDTAQFVTLEADNCKSKGTCKENADFIRSFIQDTQDSNSVWGKLRGGYCNEIPDGMYRDINGNIKNCSGSKGVN